MKSIKPLKSRVIKNLRMQEKILPSKGISKKITLYISLSLGQLKLNLFIFLEGVGGFIILRFQPWGEGVRERNSYFWVSKYKYYKILKRDTIFLTTIKLSSYYWFLYRFTPAPISCNFCECISSIRHKFFFGKGFFGRGGGGGDVEFLNYFEVPTLLEGRGQERGTLIFECLNIYIYIYIMKFWREAQNFSQLLS